MKPRPGAPYTPQSSQVEGSGQQGPFGSDIVNPTQQEPSYPLLLFDDPEDRFNQLLSHLEGGLSFLGSHPGTMTAQDRIIGAYDQAPSARPIGDAGRHDRTCLANGLGGLVHSLVRSPGVLAAYKAQHLALGSPVRVAVQVVGEPVLVVGMVLCLSFGRLWHHHLLTSISTFLQRRCRVIAGIGQGQWRLDSRHFLRPLEHGDQARVVGPLIHKFDGGDQHARRFPARPYR